MMQHTLAWSATLVWRSSPILSCISTLLALIGGTMSLAGLYLVKLLVDQAVALNGASPNTTPTGDLIIIITLIGAVVLATAVCGSAARLSLDKQSHQLTDAVYRLIHDKSLSLDLQHWEDVHYRNLLHRAQTDAATRPFRILANAFQLLQNLVSISAIIIILAVLDWRIMVLSLIATVPGAWFRIKSVSKIHHWKKERTSLERKIGYLSELLTDEQAIKDVKTHNLGITLQDRFRTARHEFYLKMRVITKWRTNNELIIQAGITTCMFAQWHCDNNDV